MFNSEKDYKKFLHLRITDVFSAWLVDPKSFFTTAIIPNIPLIMYTKQEYN